MNKQLMLKIGEPPESCLPVRHKLNKDEYMEPITATGYAHGNTMVLTEDIGLPEGVAVTIRVEIAPKPASLADSLREVIGIVNDWPPDMARNHDHYLHGSPKRCESSS